MDINKKITITLSEDDVKEIIAGYLASRGYRVVPESVKLVVENKWVGYGMSEYPKPYFKECTATMKGE